MIDDERSSAEEMSSFFDVRAEGYDSHMGFGTDERDEYFRILASPIAETEECIRILDLGCGTGEELKEVFRRAPNALVTGIDMSDGMLELLKGKHAGKEDRIDLIVGSYTELDLGIGLYDHVISSYTIHHLLHGAKLELYSRICRCLKPGGSYMEGDYIIPTPEEEETHLKNYHEAMAVVGDTTRLYHIDIPFTVETQLRLFEEAGFTDVSILHDNKRNNAIIMGTAE